MLLCVSGALSGFSHSCGLDENLANWTCASTLRRCVFFIPLHSGLCVNVVTNILLHKMAVRNVACHVGYIVSCFGIGAKADV